jgi:hypothetical protein
VAFQPRKELLWQFREDASIRCWVPRAQRREFIHWVAEQAKYHYEPEVWHPRHHILEMAGSNQRKYPGCIPIDIFCPDLNFKSIVKLAWG